ncbi:MAG: hypothetical protein ABI718_16280 [Acidobacteriota bacterium]
MGRSFRTIGFLSALVMLAAAHVATAANNPKPPKDPCKHASVLYVDDDGSPGGVGTVHAPVPTIAGALALASENNFCAVELVVSSGVYSEALSIDRTTTIRGAGNADVAVGNTISNIEGNFLTLQNLAILDAPGTGIRVARGLLKMVGVEVRGTRVAKGQNAVATGIGLSVEDGAQAVVFLSTFAQNQSQAIRVSGKGSKLWLTLSVINNTEVNPNLVDPITGLVHNEYVGALQALDSAEIHGRQVVMSDNAFSAVHVLNHARAHLSDLTVTGTTEYRAPTSSIYGGTNIAAREGGTIDLRRPHTRNADLAGMMNERAYLRSDGGDTSRNLIGLGLIGPFPAGETPIECAAELGTRSIDNEVPLSASGVLFSPPCLRGSSDCVPMSCVEVPLEPLPDWSR